MPPLQQQQQLLLLLLSPPPSLQLLLLLLLRPPRSRQRPMSQRPIPRTNFAVSVVLLQLGRRRPRGLELEQRRLLAALSPAVDVHVEGALLGFALLQQIGDEGRVARLLQVFIQRLARRRRRVARGAQVGVQVRLGVAGFRGGRDQVATSSG
jgi:hypothetical protein